GAARAGVDPALVEALEAVPETHARRHAEAERRVEELELARPRRELEATRQRTRAPVGDELLHEDGRRERVREESPRVGAHDAADRREEEPPVARLPAGGLRGAVAFGAPHSVRDPISHGADALRPA